MRNPRGRGCRLKRALGQLLERQMQQLEVTDKAADVQGLCRHEVRARACRAAQRSDRRTERNHDPAILQAVRAPRTNDETRRERYPAGTIFAGVRQSAAACSLAMVRWRSS
jgi:hypothetical protein